MLWVLPLRNEERDAVDPATAYEERDAVGPMPLRNEERDAVVPTAA